MKDIQSQLDSRRINIKKVGVKTISYPVTVLDKAKKRQHTVATVNMYVNLPHKFKGTHMSRFVEILNRFHGEIDLQSFHHILEEMKERLEAEEAHIEMSFPYFLQKENNPEVLNACRYSCRMHGSLGQNSDLELQVVVPIALPLKEQNERSLPRSMGHWGQATITVRFRQFIWIEDLILLVEKTIGREQKNSVDSKQSAPSAEAITNQLAESLATVREIQWFSIVTENLSEGYSTFAAMESEN